MMGAVAVIQTIPPSYSRSPPPWTTPPPKKIFKALYKLILMYEAWEAITKYKKKAFLCTWLLLFSHLDTDFL